MTDTLEFGIATVDELPRIIQIKLAMFVESGHIDLLATNVADIMLKDYQALYAQDEARHFVARKDSYIVASVGAFIKSDLPFRYFRSPTYGFIGDVYTEIQFRSLGIATRLSQDAMLWLQSKEIQMVRLLASEAGRSIYEKLGFVPTDEMVFTFRK